jgi:hypothetical protein
MGHDSRGVTEPVEGSKLTVGTTDGLKTYGRRRLPKTAENDRETADGQARRDGV